MNIYRHKFTAQCPVNGQEVQYELTIETDSMVSVESITKGCAFEAPIFHEEIAGHSIKLFGGRQTLKAHHHGVDIETRREA